MAKSRHEIGKLTYIKNFIKFAEVLKLLCKLNVITSWETAWPGGELIRLTIKKV